MSNRFCSLLLSCLFFSISHTYAQEITTKISLEEAIRLAHKSSPDYKIALNRAMRSYWNYRNFQARYLPQLGLSGELPNYYRSIQPITQDDGSVVYREQEIASSNLNLDLSQNIAWTGGTLSVYSSIERIDDFTGEGSRNSYSTTPISILYQQNTLLYNPFKWERKIEPLRYEESRRDFIESMEALSQETVNRYFNLLNDQIALKIAKQNKSNADTLYNIAQARYNLGKIPENELLQMEMSLLNAQNIVSQAQLNLQTSRQNFNQYMDWPLNTPLQLEVPQKFYRFKIDPQFALQQALQNRKKVLEFERRKIEADRDVAEAKNNNGLKIGIRASFGLSQTASEIQQAYRSPSDQEQFGLNLSIPLLDWGVTKSRRKMAEANRDLTQFEINQEEQNFEQEIYIQSLRWELEKEQYDIALKAQDIALKRFEISKQRYLIGKISITDLNIAISEKDQAISDYMLRLKSYWSSFYNMRKLTHYDFYADKKIDIDDIIPNFRG